MSTYREERIRPLAHEIWEREGHPHGRDTEHWRLATEAYEAELARSRGNAPDQAIESEGEGDEEPETPREWTMRVPAVATPSGATANQPLTAAPTTPRKRRTRVELEAARAAEAAVLVSPARRNRKLAEVVSADAPAPTRRARKLQADTPPASAETAPAPTRKRRTKAEMAAAALAAGAVAAGAAAVAATVTKRRLGAKAETDDSAAPVEAPSSRRSRKAKTAGEAAPAPAADAALKRLRR